MSERANDSGKEKGNFVAFLLVSFRFYREEERKSTTTSGVSFF